MAGAVKKEPLKHLDRLVRECGKRWLSLPRRAYPEVLYLYQWQGGMGLFPLATGSYIVRTPLCGRLSAFENTREALDEARWRKEERYAALSEHFREKGLQSSVEAIFVGNLGSWDPKNDAVLRGFGISRRYSTTMKRLVVSNVIRWSRDIYVEHAPARDFWGLTPLLHSCSVLTGSAASQYPVNCAEAAAELLSPLRRGEAPYSSLPYREPHSPLDD
ncbi:hypothetical protein J437_LFUL004161 [Ladona fulva]|uniref:Uncharacterized protein n=1 Tax=Ladona fulva TaxID=123851 RepID=A0A8K0K069_LADFU|nr:hypothetical protein J437_LFUL004161 [Ladona fulva]